MEVNDESGNMQVLVLMSTLGRFSNDGSDGKENAKKATSLKSTTTTLIVQKHFDTPSKREFISNVIDEL